jgi:hypothetical protein
MNRLQEKMKIKTDIDIFSFKYPYHKELKQSTLKFLENYPDVHDKKTNVKAKMTEWNISTPQIEELKKFILSNIILLYPYMINYPMTIHNFWANIYEKEDYTIDHDHFPYSFSFVYFLSCKNNHPPLIFTYSKKRINPVEGSMILFPSILKHHVPKNKLTEKRIVLAGNIKIN